MKGSGAVVSASPSSSASARPDERTGATREAGRSWAARLRDYFPVLAVAVVVVVGWYAIGLYNNVPQAQQISDPHTPFSRLLSKAMNLPQPFVPLPHQVLSDFFTALAQPLDSPRGLWIHLGATGLEAVLGLLCGFVLGILIATVFIHSRPLESAFLPYVVASQTVPVLALAPIVIGMLGITLAAKVVVAAYLSFFSIAVSMVKGFKSADALSYELMRSYAANPWQVYWKLRFPVALPYLFAGLKIAATASLVGAIIAELPFGSTTGLGARMLVATTYDQTIVWWSTMLAASILGIIAVGVIAVLERLVVKRRPTSEGA